MTAYGTIFSSETLEYAAIAALQYRLPATLAEMERQLGRPVASIQTPRSYRTVNEFGNDPDDKPPAIIVVSPGLARRPVRNGDGTYDAVYRLGVAAVVQSNSRVNTRSLARLYAAAVRHCMVRNPALASPVVEDGVADAVDWVDEDYTDIPSDQDRTTAAGSNIFEIAVPAVVDSRGGPDIPPPDDPPWINPDDDQTYLGHYAPPEESPTFQKTVVEVVLQTLNQED